MPPAARKRSTSSAQAPGSSRQNRGSFTSSALTADQYQELFDASPNFIVGIDYDYNFSFANQQALDLLKTPELIGQNIWTLFPGNLNEPFQSSYRRTMEERIPTEFEAYQPKPLDCWFRVTARPVQSGMVVFFTDITARKQAEAVRDQTSRQLHQVFEVTSDAVLSINRDWQITFVNRRAHEILAAKGDLIGKVIWEEFPVAADPASEYSICYRKCMDERVPCDFEAFYPAPLNRTFALEVRPSDEGIVLFFRDITEEKQNAEALASSEQRYRILADLNPQAIWMGAPDGSMIYANQKYLDYTGFTMERLAGTGWLGAIFPEDRPNVIKAWTRSLATGEDFNVEGRILRGYDSHPRLWWLRGLPVRDEEGAILHWLGVAMDIEDSRNSAIALYEQQQETERQRAELETIYQTADIGLALFSPDDFRYLRINDRQAAIIGLPPEEIIGKTLIEIAPDVPLLLDLFRGVAAGKPVKNFLLEGELPATPGEKRIWNVNYTPVYSTDGTIEAITAASLEVTQQKRAEAALIQSEKLAAVGRLASSISHEINNPLEAITNLLYLVSLAEDLPEQLKIYVHMAQSEVSRVSQIATQTLRFHRQAIKPTLVNPEELVDAVLNLYQGRLGNSDIKVEAHYSTSTRILCFENDIRQVLNNLIANAIDAMRHGGRIIARAHDMYEPHTNRKGVRIVIADTGHGMSAATAARVFEPFYTTKDLNGTGLGLWISAGIVERHHGRLTVRSSQHPIHHGTVFSLFLPCDEAPLAHPANMALSSSFGG